MVSALPSSSARMVLMRATSPVYGSGEGGVSGSVQIGGWGGGGRSMSKSCQLTLFSAFFTPILNMKLGILKAKMHVATNRERMIDG